MSSKINKAELVFPKWSSLRINPSVRPTDLGWRRMQGGRPAVGPTWKPLANPRVARLPKETDGRAMDYRLYFKEPDGQVQRVEILDCESDSEAIFIAEEQMRDGVAIELWAFSRKVCDFPNLTA
jgi:hypothetical protein